MKIDNKIKFLCDNIIRDIKNNRNIDDLENYLYRAFYEVYVEGQNYEAPDIDKDYNEGYSHGYRDGVYDGKDDGYSEGYEDGYQIGLKEGKNHA